MEQKVKLAINCLLHGEAEPLYELVRADLDIANTAYINKRGIPKTLLGEFMSCIWAMPVDKTAILATLLNMGVSPDPPPLAKEFDNLSSQKLYNITPLAMTLGITATERSELLLSAGAEIDSVYRALPYNSLFRGSLFVRSEDEIPGFMAKMDYLDSIGFDFPEFENAQSTSLLEHCVDKFHYTSAEVLDRLLLTGIDIDGTCGEGVSALAGALFDRYYSMAMLLLDRGATLSSWCGFNEANIPFTLATYYDGMPETLVSRLMQNQNPSEPHGDPSWQLTPLHECVRTENYSIMEWLLANGADPNAHASVSDQKALSNTLRSGDTPLHMAIRAKDRKAIDFLVNAGARLDTRNKDGDGCLDIAREQTKFKVVVTQLEKAGAITFRKAGSSPDLQPTQQDLMALIEPGELWADTAIRYFSELDANGTAQWYALLKHCSDRKKPTPDKRWLTKASDLVSAIGVGELRLRYCEWMRMLKEKRTSTELDKEQYSSDVYKRYHRYSPIIEQMITANNVRLLTGMLWSTSLVADDTLAAIVADVARAMYKKVGHVGMRNATVANAAANALANMHEAGLHELMQLERLVTYGAAWSNLDRIRHKAIEARNLDPEDIERLETPRLPLDEHGNFERRIGKHTAIISFPSTATARIEWQADGSEGKRQKSVPAAVKANYAEELRELKAYAKQLERALRYEQKRLESVWRTGRTWTLDEWQSLFIRPGSVGRLLAWRLIWVLSNDQGVISALPGTTGWTDRLGNAVPEQPDYTVSLWHPAEAESPAEISDWQTRVIDLRLNQPLKQAWREVYLRTDREFTESGASERFTGHVVHNHRFNALAAQIGWQHELCGNWDGQRDTSAVRYVPGTDTYVELVTQPIEDWFTARGIFRFLVTGAVRTVAIGQGKPVALESLPKRVFSEIYRDLDLLVSVPNVGRDADEDWKSVKFDDWTLNLLQIFAEGPLGKSATQRRELLKQVLPILPIADRCTLTDRFLVVSGTLGDYRIHLGSGNVGMAAGNRALVMPNVGKNTHGYFVPFESDHALDDILAKAKTLANDNRIRNPELLEQIVGGQTAA